MGRKRNPPTAGACLTQRLNDVSAGEEIARAAHWSAIDHQGDVNWRAAVRERPALDFNFRLRLAPLPGCGDDIDVAAQFDQEVRTSRGMPQLGYEGCVPGVPRIAHPVRANTRVESC